MQVLHCRDAGFDCDAIVRGRTAEEVFDQVRPHAVKVHGIELTRELEIQLRPLLRDEE